jgi:benzoyl-CoA reductase subunit B
MAEHPIFEVTDEEVEKVRKKVRANTPRTVVKMGKLVDNYWAEVRSAHDDGKKVAWHVAAPGTILTAAAGMPTLLHAAYAPLATGRRIEEPVMEMAEEFGFLPDTCSYIRCHMGLVHAWNTGQIEKLDPILRVPKPDLVVIGRICTEHSTLGELVARHSDCPVALIDLQPTGCVTEGDFDRRVHYVERQLKEDVIPLIEKVTGRPYDYDKLSEMLAITKKVATLRDELAELMKNKPSPVTMFDLGISIGTLICEMGRPETVSYYQELLDEAKERVAKGIGVIPEEKYRIYWDGYSTWSVLGTVMRSLAPRGGIPLIGRYVKSFWRHPQFIDPERPLWTVANQMIRHMCTLIFPQWGQQYIMDLIEPYSIDGLIMLSFVTCRMWNIGQEEFAHEAERRFGIPSLIFQADMVDRAHVNESQLDTRIEAFLEMIDARRRRWV